MGQGEVIDSLDYPKDVCQYFNLAKRPLHYRNTEIFCFDIIVILGEEFLKKKRINPFHTVFLKDPESRAGTAAA